MKIALFGAGSAQFGCGMLGDIFQSDVLKGAEVALMDIDAAAVEKVRAAGKATVEKKGLDFEVTATTDRRKALKGADFVIISIEVGDRFALWEMDRTLPQQYGIRQVYGENGGPGGLFHALRITPPILEICEDAAAICPEAWIFNYSNPMTAIGTTVSRKYPDLNFVGMCHEIASLKRYLPVILETPLENIRFRAAGLNHFSVLLEASFAENGKDAYPTIRERAPGFFESLPGYREIREYELRTGKHDVWPEGADYMPNIDRKTSMVPWSDRTLFKEIFDHYDFLPITVDSHFGEYLSWAWEVSDHQGIMDFLDHYRGELTRENRYEIPLEPSERVVPVIEGIVGDTGYEEAAVNVMNRGLIPALPEDIVVEVPAKVRRAELEGIPFPDYPKGLAALLRNYYGTYDLTAEAILTGKKEYVIQALLANPVVDRIKPIPELVDVMIDRQREWLGYLL